MKTSIIANPARLYMASLSKGSQGMRRCLDKIVDILDPSHSIDTYPWWRLTYADGMVVRQALVARYQGATVNKILSTLRGVLKQSWALGLIDADTYQRAAAVPNVRASKLPAGRALEMPEIVKLFTACTSDASAKGARDAAMLTVLYGCGLRRGEVARLDVADVDLEDGAILVHGKGNKERQVYLTDAGCQYLAAWLNVRGDEPGPLFCPIRQTGEVRHTRLRGSCIAYILRCRQKQAGVDHFSAHDLRRSNVSHMLDAGVDVFTVQQLAGHANADTTRRYDRRGERAKRQAVRSLELPSLAA